MANPKVQKILDKSKKFFTNHGDKLAVGIGSLVFVAGAALAITKPTIAITPDQISSNTESAKKNLDQPQTDEEILESLANDGVKELNFAETVAKTETEKVDVNELKLKHRWVTLEPGAGLIRDQPVLVAINEVMATSGRGGATLFELDDKGKRIPDDGSDATKEEEKSGRGGRGGRGGGLGLGMGMGGTQKKSDIQKQEEKAQEKREAERLNRSLAGSANPERDRRREEKAKSGGNVDPASPEGGTTEPEQQGPFKEKLQSLRWAVVTGIVDHKALKQAYAKALRQDEKATNPNYKYVELERQTLGTDGSWGSWEKVDINKKYAVLDNLTETDEELVPEENRLESICDSLPFLLNGACCGVHIASLVPKEKREIKRPDPNQGLGGMAGMGMMGGRGRGGMGMMGGGGGQAGMGMMASGGGGGKGGGMGMMGEDGYAGFMFGGGTGSADEGDFPKTDEDEVMVRAFDFSVDPDATYRYRARLVVVNPNYKRDDINPGVDTNAETLSGPWSETTNPVYVPSDVATYAVQKTPPQNQQTTSDKVTFNVTSFNPEDGVTVVRQFIAGPGQIIGEPTTTQIPATDGSGAKPKTIDFTSRQIVLATEGGTQSLAPLGGNGSITMPAMAFVMKGDGSIVIRNEARDVNDPDLDFTRRVYMEELKKSDKKRERGSMMDFGMGMGGMGMGGSMGPGGY
jgi:hypothetical protein